MQFRELNLLNVTVMEVVQLGFTWLAGWLQHCALSPCTALPLGKAKLRTLLKNGCGLPDSTLGSHTVFRDICGGGGRGVGRLGNNLALGNCWKRFPPGACFLQRRDLIKTSDRGILLLASVRSILA